MRPGDAVGGRMVYLVGVLLLVVGMPWHEIVVRVWPATRYWDELVILAFALCLAVGMVRSRRLPAPRLLIPMGVFLGVALLSGWLNALPLGQVAIGVRALFPYMIAGLAAAHLPEHRIRPVLRVLVIGGGLAAVYGIASYVAFRTWDRCLFIPQEPRSFSEAVLMFPYQCGAYPKGWRLAGSFLNDNFLGDWLGMLVPIAFFLGDAERQRSRRFGYLLAAVAMTIALACTFSRAAYLGFGAGLLVYAWRAERRVLLFLPVLVLAAGLAARPGDVYRFRYLRKTEGGRVAAVRKVTVQARSPVYGRGPGTTGVMDLHYARIAAQTGFLGLLAFGWLLAVAVAPGFRSRQDGTERGGIRTTLFAASVPMLVGALGGDVWEIPQLAYTFWIFAGLLQVPQSREGALSTTLPGAPGGAAHSGAAGGTGEGAAAAAPGPAGAGC